MFMNGGGFWDSYQLLSLNLLFSLKGVEMKPQQIQMKSVLQRSFLQEAEALKRHGPTPSS